MSQEKVILSALKRREFLTPLEALKRYGCLRLAARVKDLRDKGIKVKTTMIEVDGARVARYSL